ncbi:hypothetical protein D7Z54_07650 [Salibacterium salarium]|uniref:Uncharacterized protein n=1 Tax=Salibacterium salarium TaxID=284579 RepID=A0A3R9WUU4_9BACI|nr:hypothetical protein [Salibacterium salarium]RSL33980.1 hypothetical protein D7Z54_07650 [Salibacterium salarium]
MSVTDFKAMQKWAKLPKDIQETLRSNVYCSTCVVTTIVHYDICEEDMGIVLKGKCKTCGGDVARFIEDE